MKNTKFWSQFLFFHITFLSVFLFSEVTLSNNMNFRCTTLQLAIYTYTLWSTHFQMSSFHVVCIFKALHKYYIYTIASFKRYANKNNWVYISSLVSYLCMFTPIFVILTVEFIFRFQKCSTRIKLPSYQMKQAFCFLFWH